MADPEGFTWTPPAPVQQASRSITWSQTMTVADSEGVRSNTAPQLPFLNIVWDEIIWSQWAPHIYTYEPLFRNPGSAPAALASLCVWLLRIHCSLIWNLLHWPISILAILQDTFLRKDLCRNLKSLSNEWKSMIKSWHSHAVWTWV